MITVAQKSRIKSYAKRAFMVTLTVVVIVGMLDIGGRRSLQRGQDGTPWAMRINGQEVSEFDFLHNVAKQQEHIKTLRERYGTYADEILKAYGGEKAAQQLAAEEIKRDAVLNQVAQSIPVYIGQEYFTNKINDPGFMFHSGLAEILPLGTYTPQGLDLQRLKQFAMQHNIAMQHVEQWLQEGLARYMVLELANLGVVVDLKSIEQAQAHGNDTYQFALLHLPFDHYLQQEKARAVDQADLKQFFDRENSASKRYLIPERRAGNVWAVTPQDYGIIVKEQAIKDYYEENKVYKYVQSPAQVEVRAILLKVDDAAGKDAIWKQARELHAQLTADPKSFAAKAKELSQDKATASNGGLIPAFKKGQKDPVFERKAFTLNAPEALSEPFETSEGIHIVQLVRKDPVTFKPLSEVQKDIEQLLLMQKFSKRFARDMKEFRSQPNEKQFQEFLARVKGVKSTRELTADDGSKVMRELFRLKKNGIGAFVDQQKGYIVQLTEIQKAYVPTLDTIESTVKADYIQHQAAQALQDALVAAKKALHHETADTVAKQAGARLTQTDFIAIDEQSIKRTFGIDGLSPESIMQLEKKGMALQHTNRDGYIVMVTDVKKSDKELDGEAKQRIATKVAQERKSLFLQGFIASLSRNATIETNKLLPIANEK